jgi:integrase
MDIGVSSSERKPVATVTVGSVAISIYAAPVTVRTKSKSAATDSSNAASVPESKTYQSFQVAHYEGNRRVLQRRNTLDKAKALAKEIAGRLNRDGSRAQYFTEKDRRIYTLAQMKSQSLGLEVDEVCRKYGELQQRLKTGTLEEAVDFFNSHGQRVRHGAAIESVYEEYLQHLTKRGAGHYHLRDVKRYVGNFVETFPGLISAIQTPEIDAFFARLGGSARNKNNHRRGIIAFYNFAQEKGFLPHGILHASAATTDFRDARSQITSEQQAIDLLQPFDIYSPEEMRKILAAEGEPLIRPTLEIKAFSGVRTEEIVRLWWVMVAEAEGCLKVPDAVGKICARRVPLLPNLQARLAKYPAESKQGRVSVNWPSANSLTRAWRRVIEKAGVPYRRNAFRNSYITYRLILTEDIGKVAEECGTSPKMIKKNYQSRAAISRATAEEWFSI